MSQAQPSTMVSARLDRIRRRLHPATAPVLLAMGGLAAATLVHFVDPNEPGNYPTCPWLLLTGTYCPGCGTMRAVHALTYLDLSGALQMNVLLLTLLPFMLWAWAKSFYRAFRPPKRPPKLAHPAWLWALLIGIIAFWIVRNLPFAAFLAPGG